jgi:Flp pilus assembly protein CpaB
MIRPGDHVDLMGMVPIPAMGLDGKQTVQMSTMPLFQDVLILAVGEEFSNVSGGKSSEKMIPAVTLALTPQEANLVAFVQEQGKIRLILRSPEDTQVQPAVPASWDTLFMTVMPQLFQKQEEKPVMRQRKVEIIRGLSKEEKVLE